MTTCTLVLKFALERPRTEIPVQVNDKLLGVGIDVEHGEECLAAWFEVNKAEVLELRPSTLYVVRSGELLPEPGLTFVGTVPRSGSRPVLHVFERRAPKPEPMCERPKPRRTPPPWIYQAARMRRGWLWLHATRRRPRNDEP